MDASWPRETPGTSKSILDIGEPYFVACVTGDLATARCLRRLGVPWGPDGQVFLDAAAAGHATAPLPLLRWLLEEGCPVDYDVMLEWGASTPQRAAKVLLLLMEHLGRQELEHDEQ
ncbi:hypothetical protein GPECTOR_30g175 [Gonium pectorale]|uniref:Uncharacterized protein n=1 Tax=Gonium pectorale TaxID=33097 RepID=A0A150GFH5_GONPE|nr:hypothetical protein GPECTOR_30g175 [Gonium pectorale]|eukprot:KXZ48080.1 hypothetical protein GPECTOR_30g175 [Gonium pectorale]